MGCLSLLSPFTVCKRDRRETEVFREETTELEQEQEITATWLLSKDAFRHLVRGFY